MDVAEIEVEMPSFGADVPSYLQFIGLRRSVMIYTDLEVVFKPLAADGLLLYTVLSRQLPVERPPKSGQYVDERSSAIQWLGGGRQR